MDQNGSTLIEIERKWINIHRNGSKRIEIDRNGSNGSKWIAMDRGQVFYLSVTNVGQCVVTLEVVPERQFFPVVFAVH
jgi:hypothetical protein